MEPSIQQVERRERRGKRLTSAALLATTAILASTWLGLFLFLSSNAAFGTFKTVEDQYFCDYQNLALDFPDLGRLSEVYTQDNVLLGTLTERNSQPVPLSEVPELVINTILSAEDADFYNHNGIDYASILRSALTVATTGDLDGGGGSTITQQTVKKNFLTDELTLERKVCEALVAGELERRYTKDQILEFYLNFNFYGENAYGIAAASQEYYDKPLSQLSIAEAASIVTPIRNPSLYNLRDKPEYVIPARDRIIDEMVDNGFITEAEGRDAKAEPLNPVPHKGFDEISPRVIIAAREEVLSSAKYGLGETYTERKTAMFGCAASDVECEGGGGLKIFVTVNDKMQQEANRILLSTFRDTTGPTGAIAMIDNATGAVRVMSSGLAFGENFEAGERNYDLAREGRRQAGSAFKPIALLAALEKGSKDGRPITLGSYFADKSPLDIECGSPCASDGSSTWTVRNAGTSGGGIRTLERGTYSSTNTVYAQVSLQVGPENIVEMAHRVGIKSPLNPVLSIALGVESVSPLEMASAYSTIANTGEKVETYLIERIEDADGNVIYQHEVKRERVLDAALVGAAREAMEKVVSIGTARRAQIDRPQAGKTGTAQNFRDVWFMGMIPQYTTAVWVGYPDGQVEMEKFTIFNDVTQKPQFFTRAYGGTVAAPIWKQFMLWVTEDLPVEDFFRPEGTAAYYKTPDTEIPDISELTDEQEIIDAIHLAGLNVEVTTIPSVEEEGTVLLTEPEIGTTVRQGSSVTVNIASGELPTLPNLTRITLADAIAALEAFNEETGAAVTWTVQDFVVGDPIAVGKVVVTNPAPGGEIQFEQTITLFVGVFET